MMRTRLLALLLLASPCAFAQETPPDAGPSRDPTQVKPGAYVLDPAHGLAERLLILGVIEAVVTAVLGAILIVVGRKDYKAYRKRTGRVN